MTSPPGPAPVKFFAHSSVVFTCSTSSSRAAKEWRSHDGRGRVARTGQWSSFSADDQDEQAAAGQDGGWKQYEPAGRARTARFGQGGCTSPTAGCRRSAGRCEAIPVVLSSLTISRQAALLSAPRQLLLPGRETRHGTCGAQAGYALCPGVVHVPVEARGRSVVGSAQDVAHRGAAGAAAGGGPHELEGALGLALGEVGGVDAEEEGGVEAQLRGCVLS